jgi:hypothetical protein
MFKQTPIKCAGCEIFMDLDKRITEAIQMVQEQQSLKSRLQTTHEMLGKERSRYNDLKKQLALENKDVERLDGFTLNNLWHTLRGNKEIAKRKEQEEYLAAKMKFDAAGTTVAMLETDLTRLEQQLTAMGDPEPEYRQAMQAKENILLASGQPEAGHLFDLSEKAGKLKAGQKELQEAINAGEKAVAALSNVKRSLSNAESWGLFDILGGGLITTAIKHSRIGDARDKVEQAQNMLCIFNRELADLQQHTDIIGISKISIAADFLLDGLFDIIVQFQINAAMNNTNQLQKKVEYVMQHLLEVQEQNQMQALRIDNERKRIIENANCTTE